ncbi:MAG: hypothetical protein Q9160_004439 [Pyrenula sp. 1 TL-2023]
MLEAKEGCAILDDIDSETFVRFSEYAYTGCYTNPVPDIIVARAGEEDPNIEEDENGNYVKVKQWPNSELASLPFFTPWHREQPTTAIPEPVENEEEKWGLSKARSKKELKARFLKFEEPPEAKPPAKRERLWQNFRKPLQNKAPPSLYTEPRESWNDYTGILLCHAQVYVLADKYQIDPLAKLAVKKLQCVLSKMMLHNEELTSVTKLLEYTYSHTVDRDDNKLDMLRELIIHYSACIIEFLDRDEGFRELLENEGAIGRDLIRKMLARLD